MHITLFAYELNLIEGLFILENSLNMSKYEFQEQEKQQEAYGLERWSPPTKYMYTIFMHKTWNIKGERDF